MSKSPPQASTEEKEPNDDIGSATLITEGTTVRGSIATLQGRISLHSVHPVLEHELFYESDFPRELTFTIMSRNGLPVIMKMKTQLSAFPLKVPLALPIT